MNAHNYDCSRCLGRGKISGYSHVIGGTCFKCHGTGKQKTKPSTSKTWAVLDSKGKHAYNIKAKTAEKAVKIARVTWQGSSPDFKAEHDLTVAEAVPLELWRDLHPIEEP